MNATRILTLVLSAGLVGTSLGCAQTSTTATAPEPAIPQLQAPANGAVAPENLLVGNQQTMVNGQTLTVEQIRQQLPSRISAADAAKMLVKIDESQVALEGSDQNTQQLRRFGGRSFFGRGIYGGLRYRSRFFGRGIYGGLSYYPYGSYYFPYYNYGSYYYPYTYSYGSYLYSPYFYGYGARYWPYTYGWIR